VVLTDANFDQSIKQGDWLLEFYAPWCGHCKKLAPTYEEVATTLKGKINVGKVDCTTEKEVAERFGVRGYPTLKFYKASEGRVYDYSGDRSLDSFKTFTEGGYSAAESKPLPTVASADDPTKSESSDVVILTDTNFDLELAKGGNWLLEFYAPWCGHCKKLAPTYDKVATSLKDKVKVGKVDCTVETGLAKRFGIRGYPTLKFVAGGSVYEYKGDRSQDDLVKFATSTFQTLESSPLPVPPTEFQLFLDDVALGIRQLETLLSSRLWIVLACVFFLGLTIGKFVLSDGPALPPVPKAATTAKTDRKQD